MIGDSVPPGGLAVVVGAGGGIGSALLAHLQAEPGFARVMGLGRHSDLALDVHGADSVERAARHLESLALPLRVVIVTVGFLHGEGQSPEKGWRDIDAAHLARAFAINAIGPALLMKNFLPLLPAQGRCVFAVLSAKVGSIGDNQLGGWYAYRASKAALNQLVRTAAIELKRRRPEALCVALHPGTVDTPLSAPFAKTHLQVQTPAQAAARLLNTIAGLPPEATGGFFDPDGRALPW